MHLINRSLCFTILFSYPLLAFTQGRMIFRCKFDGKSNCKTTRNLTDYAEFEANIRECILNEKRLKKWQPNERMKTSDPILDKDTFKVTNNVNTLFPNPFHSTLNIHMVEYSGEYVISNLLGEAIKEGSLKKGMNTINTTQMPKGLYIIKINQNKGEKIEKL